MVFGLFKRKQDLQNKVAVAFSKVDQDISHINHWLGHLQSKQQELHSKHEVNITITQKELNALKQWISFLHSHTSTLHSQVKNNQVEAESLKKEMAELKQQLTDLSLKVKTAPITLRNQPITPELRDDTRNYGRITPEKNSGFDISALNLTSLSSSEKQVLTLLFSSENPLTYAQLAQKLGLNYGTVKNLISRIRGKGFDVQSQSTPDGEKEFFLTKKLKIELSGR